MCTFRFLFFVFNYLQKRKVFTAGNLYAAHNLANMTKADFVSLLNESDQQAQQLVKQITRQGAGILGSAAYMKKLGNCALNFINFHRHHSKDMSNFNYFLTLSSSDVHCNGFMRLFPEGQAHLSKKLVKNVEEIPQGADKTLYTTSSEDFLFRRDMIIKYARFYDLYFRHKVETYIRKVFMDTLGAKDFICRYEFQSRSAIHVHLLIVMPCELSRADRLNAIRPWHQEATLQEIARLLDSPVLAPPGTEEAAEIHRKLGSGAAKAVKTRRKLAEVATLEWGLTESHPSNSLSDRLPVHGGTMMRNPSSQVLRSTLAQCLEEPFPSIVNLVNKVGIHQCRTSYCLKPRRQAQPPTTTNEPAPAVQCRFGFPMSFVDYEPTPTGLQRIDPPTLGGVYRVNDPASVFHGQTRMLLPRNHTNTVIRTNDITLTWKANTCSMFAFTEDEIKEYVSKYTSKTETTSTASLDLEAEILNHLGSDNVNTAAQKVLLKYHKSRDYGHAEVCLFANKGEAIFFSSFFNTFLFCFKSL